MLRAENLIVEGKYYVGIPSSTEADKYFLNIRRMLSDYLYGAGYYEYNIISPFSKNYFSMNFRLGTKGIVPPKRKYLFKKIEPDFLDCLEYIRIDYPLEISTVFKLEEKKILIETTSKPVVLFKFIQLHKKPVLNEFRLSCILETNKTFIHQLMSSIHAVPINKPQAKAELKKIYLHDTLEGLELDNLANILERGILKISRGNTEDGLTDLRSSLEIFLYEMVKKINVKPEPQDKIKANLNILKNNGYINDRMFNLIHQVFYNWIFSYLSDKPIHKREILNTNDAEFVYHLVEEFMDYIIKKVVYRV